MTPYRRGALCLTLFFLSTCIWAAAPGDPPRRPPAKVTFHKAPSEESPEARERRLKRECKGRPNAGMCLGYALP